MATLGDMLRAAREERGLSPDDVERATRIRARYVHALEQQQFQELPGDVYARGFVRNYAIFLGLPVDEALAAYETATLPPRGRGLRGGTTLASPPVPALTAPSLRTTTDRPVATSAAREVVPRIQPVSPVPIDTRLRYAPSCTVVSGLGVVLLLAFYLIFTTYTSSQKALPTPTPPPPTPTTLTSILPTVLISQTPVWTPLPTPGPSPIPSPPLPPTAVAVAPGPTPPPGATPGGGVGGLPTATPVNAAVQVEVTLSQQPVWFRVVVDDAQAFVGTLPARTVRSWTGNKTIQIRTGRGDIVRVKVNGVDRGLLGSASQTVITKQWDVTGTETVVK